MVFSQEILWENTIGGDDSEWLEGIIQNSEGNYVLSGYSYSNNSGDKTTNSRGQGDMWLVELNKAGNILRQKTIGGREHDHLEKTIQTRDGGYILGGRSYSGVTGEKTDPLRGYRDTWIVKLNASWEIEWQQTFGGDWLDDLTDINETPDGGYILGINSQSGLFGDKTGASRGYTDIWILKLSSLGEIEWQHTYGGDSYDSPYTIQPTPDGGYIVGATSASGISGEKTEPSRGIGDYWILKLDSRGNIVWQKTYGGYDGDILTSLLQTADGGYLIGGYSASPPSGEKDEYIYAMDFWIIKIDSTGNIQWQKIIGGDNSDHLEKMAPSKNGGFILGGISHSGVGHDKSEPHIGGRDYWIVKINEQGDVCWDKTMGGTDNDHMWDFTEDSDGNIISAGWSDSNAGGDKSENLIGIRDYWVVKISQPQYENPIAYDLAEITTCDPDRDGFADTFDTSKVTELVKGNQSNVNVRYFDQEGTELENPLPNPFLNTVQNLQILTVRVERSDNKCAFSETTLQLRISPCEEPVRELLLFPQFFTPNGDGQNDNWIPKTGVRLRHVHIFDRFGKLLKELDPNGPGWDGTFQGKDMPSDDYWYRIVTTNELIQTGHFSLIRGSF